MKILGFKRPGLPNQVNFPLCLAPMVGISHAAFRDCLSDYLPQEAVTIWPSEMLNSRRIPNENLATTPESIKRTDETFWMPQILGNEEVPIKKSVKKLLEWGANGIDINMGCPVKKALRHNYGVALMGDPSYAGNVVKMTKANCPAPVSVKLRAGQQSDIQKLTEFVCALEASGADWLTIHPRDPEQQRRGRAYWPQIKLMREKITIPVIGNGDIHTATDVIDMFEQTDCDMVMAGRALTARPWMFWQLGEILGWPAPPGKNTKAPQSEEEEAQELYHFLIKLSFKMESYFPNNVAINKFNFFIKTCSPWLIHGNFFWGKVSAKNSFQEKRDYIHSFFSEPQRLMQKTLLSQ